MTKKIFKSISVLFVVLVSALSINKENEEDKEE